MKIQGKACFPNEGGHGKPLWEKAWWCEAKVVFPQIPEGELSAVEMGHYEKMPLWDISLFIEILVGHVPN